MFYELCAYQSGRPPEDLIPPRPAHSPPPGGSGLSGTRTGVRISWRCGIAAGPRVRPNGLPVPLTVPGPRHGNPADRPPRQQQAGERALAASRGPWPPSPSPAGCHAFPVPVEPSPAPRPRPPRTAPRAGTPHSSRPSPPRTRSRQRGAPAVRAGTTSARKAQTFLAPRACSGCRVTSTGPDGQTPLGPPALPRCLLGVSAALGTDQADDPPACVCSVCLAAAGL